MNTNVAIIGSTGQNAAAWTDAFLAAGFTVRNLVRFPEQLPKRPGSQYARLELDDSSTHRPALKDIHTLCLITPSHPDQVRREVGLIYAAKQAGVRRIIKLSVIGAEFVCPISAFARWHADIEEVLRTSDIPHVILRANFFMQNALLQRASIEAGVYAEPITNHAISYVDVRDVADVAVAVARGDFDDQALSLTGREAIGGERISNLLGQTIGKRIRFVSPDLSSFRSALAEKKLPDWHIDALVELYTRIQEGRAAHVSSISADIENVTGKRPRSFIEFAQEVLGGRVARRHSAHAQASRRFWYHLFHHNLSREQDWPIGFRL
ncbi:MAG: NmrA family NAD(P)-binding protein [Verrucomicrobia bacterium]|nr:NmrA family NAD(P)-binding protein [Verrucomicrobiota bacterium]